MRIESDLAADRGDGIRGSTRHTDQGQHAVTFVEPLRRLAGGDPLPRPPGDRPHPPDPHPPRPNAATRSSAKRSTFATCFAPAAQPLPAPRLMLHAAPLGFRHPVTNVALELDRARRPPDFVAVLESLGGSRGDL